MTVNELRKRMKLSQSKFARYFEIPVQTLQKWERGGSVPVPYIPKMMKRILDLEEKVKELEEKLKGDIET